MTTKTKNKPPSIWLLLVLIVMIGTGTQLFTISPPEAQIERQYATDMWLIEGNSVKAICPPAEVKFTVLAAMTTAYNPVPEQTDSTPDIMASGNRVYEGAVACPRWIPFGTTIEIGNDTYVCEDRTHLKNDGTFDILMFSRNEALEYGRQIKEVKVY